MAMFTRSVDDLLYGVLPQGGAVLQRILDILQLGMVESQNFRLCGKEYIQDDEHNVTVTARENTERIGSVTYDTKEKLNTLCGEAGGAAEIRDRITILDC